MKIEVIKGSETLKIDESCFPAWEKAGWKKKTDEKESKASK